MRYHLWTVAHTLASALQIRFGPEFPINKKEKMLCKYITGKNIALNEIQATVIRLRGEKIHKSSLCRFNSRTL